jgi:hypothetical protein
LNLGWLLYAPLDSTGGQFRTSLDGFKEGDWPVLADGYNNRGVISGYRGTGMQIRFFIVTGILVLAASAGNSSAQAATWGCEARNSSSWWGNTFGYETKEEASAAALKLCAKSDCHIIDCNPNIDTSAKADSTWPPPAPQTRCLKAGC